MTDGRQFGDISTKGQSHFAIQVGAILDGEVVATKQDSFSSEIVRTNTEYAGPVKLEIGSGISENP